MKYYYRSLKENEDYIIIGNRKTFFEMITDKRIPENTKVEDMVKTMYYSLFLFETENGYGYIDMDFIVRKDSYLGMFIINNPDIFIDDDNYISYDKVINAYLISSYTEQAKINNKIFRLLKDKQSGTKEELITQHSETVLNYILNNPSFDEFIKNEEKKIIKTNKKYIVYEDDNYSVIDLAKEKSNQKVKKEQAS